MKRLIIFDWDDVIVLGARKGYFACYQKCLDDLNITLPQDEVERRILERWGKPLEEELELLFKEFPRLLPEAIEIFKAAFEGATFINELHILNGMLDKLQQLSDKYILAVASGNTRKMIQKGMERFSIPSTYFSKIITSHEVPKGKSKPNPYMLNELLKILNISPHEAYFVGDAKGDVEMGRKAHIEPIAVLTGNLSKEEARKIDIQLVFDNIMEASEFLLS